MKTQKQILALGILFFVALPTAASAATVSLHAAPDVVGAGDTVRVSVILDSFIPTNTFSGALRYSGNILEPIAISNGNSIIQMWVVHPIVPASEAPITFAGITPGGFSGSGGNLFSVLFLAKTAGTAKISFDEIEVLRNDGVGGEEPVTTRPLSLSVGSEPFGGYTEPTDNIPPESFTVYFGSEPELFDDRSYIVFAAVDKISGIDHYKVAESRMPSFMLKFFPLSWNEQTASPYVVGDQDLVSTIYVKAVDRAGNERVSTFPPQHLFTRYERGAFLGILILLVFFWQIRGRKGRFGKNP